MFLQKRRVKVILRAQDHLGLESSLLYSRPHLGPGQMSLFLLLGPPHSLACEPARSLEKPWSPSCLMLISRCLLLPCSGCRLRSHTPYSSVHSFSCFSNHASLSRLLVLPTLSLPLPARLQFEVWKPFIFSAPRRTPKSLRGCHSNSSPA